MASGRIDTGNSLPPGSASPPRFRLEHRDRAANTRSHQRICLGVCDPSWTDRPGATWS